jgi:hypothetical protein
MFRWFRQLPLLGQISVWVHMKWLLQHCWHSLSWLKLVFASIGFRDGRSPSFIALDLCLSLDLQLWHLFLSACRFGHLFLSAF